MSLKILIINGLLWKFSERFLSQLITFIISIILARILAPHDYGLIALVNIFLTIANVFATTGFSSALIQKKDCTSEDFSTIFYCSLLTSLLLYLIIYTSAPSLSKFYNMPELTLILRVLGIQLPIAAYSAILNAWVAQKMSFRVSFLSTFVGNIIAGFVGLYLAYNGFGVWALVYQTLCYLIISTVILNLLINWHPRWYFSMSRAKTLLDYGWKILFTDLLGTTFSQLAAFIIGKKYTLSELAFFNRGKQFPELITSNIDAPITAVLFPAMSKFSDQPQIIKKMVRQSIRFTTFLLAPLMMGLIAVAQPLVELLLTEKWLPAVPYLQLVCLERLFATLNNANMQAIKALGKSDILLKLEFIKKPIYIIMIFIAASYSVIAIAIAIACYGIIALVINTYPNKALLNYSLIEQVSDIYLSFLYSIIMLIAIYPIAYWINNSLLLICVQISVGTIIYALLSFLSKNSVTYEFITLIKKKDSSQN